VSGRRPRAYSARDGGPWLIRRGTAAVVAARAARRLEQPSAASTTCCRLCGPDLGLAGPSKKVAGVVAGHRGSGRHGSGGCWCWWFLRVNKGRRSSLGDASGRPDMGLLRQ
jgi:hypothetical protein